MGTRVEEGRKEGSREESDQQRLNYCIVFIETLIFIFSYK
jgi:hypothetical protein